MAITKGLIEQMNGSIEVTSQVGVGSVFVITIPFEIAQEQKRMRKLLRNMIFVDCICWQLRIMSLMLKS